MAADRPPPVPPKDQRYAAEMQVESPPSAPTSGSKRKRQYTEEVSHEFDAAHSHIADTGKRTPKRTCTDVHSHIEEGYASDEATPAYPHNVRRKKGSCNLSNLNLRHAAAKQKSQALQVRESKFQEGSLTDKPSEKPPSVFTRILRADNGNNQRVENLMEDYHDGVFTPRDSLEAVIEHEKAQIPERVAAIQADCHKKESETGLFRFGRSIAANFRPVALWNKLWNESREDLRNESIEAERKAKLKAAAENKYVRVTLDEEFHSQAADAMPAQSNGGVTGNHAQRDSGIVIDGMHPVLDHTRSTSLASQSQLVLDESTCYSSSEMSDTGRRTMRGSKSRLHFKKPSLSNIKSNLKRVASDLNLAQTAGVRESSSSVSPVKADYDTGTLKKSHSRLDLKRQQKLSKRVSNLELKLQNARKDLDNALIEASPMPKHGSKYLMFAPLSTRGRSVLRPSRLPALPSERILILAHNEDFGNDAVADAELDPGRAIDSEMSVAEDDTKAETLKACEHQQLRHVADIFESVKAEIHRHESIEVAMDSVPPQSNEGLDGGEDSEMITEQLIATEVLSETDPKDREAREMDVEAAAAVSKTTKRAVRSRKRKSGVATEDKLFRPKAESDDEEDFSEESRTPKKKRRSANRKTLRRDADIAETSPIRGAENPTDLRLLPKSDQMIVSADGTTAGAAHDDVQEGTAPSQRNSMESQGLPLEPLLEEDEDVTITTVSKIPLNDEPSRSTAKATAARFNRSTLRARSTSPNKRNMEVEVCTHEEDASARTEHDRVLIECPEPQRSAQCAHAQQELALVGDGALRGMLYSADCDYKRTDKENEQSKKITGNEERKFEWPDDVF